MRSDPKCPRCKKGTPSPQPAEAETVWKCPLCSFGWDSILSCFVLREDRDDATDLIKLRLEREQRLREDDPRKTGETGY